MFHILHCGGLLKTTIRHGFSHCWMLYGCLYLLSSTSFELWIFVNHTRSPYSYIVNIISIWLKAHIAFFCFLNDDKYQPVKSNTSNWLHFFIQDVHPNSRAITMNIILASNKQCFIKYLNNQCISIYTKKKDDKKILKILFPIFHCISLTDH